MSATTLTRLKRARYPMPAFLKDALVQRGLMEAYRSRPAYQKNDYIGWITRAKRQETRIKRLEQMLTELERGDKYMNMDYRARA
jgi:uncharacterized protein YdeI (YjbR/CyaY-like superfamily)